jgi:2-keto-4-pentenoate hydratase/2-oxohepta-3-ene-1,7-dioic acid hydratase in catechol pathway
MKFLRFEYKGKIYNGMAETEDINVIKGNFWDHYDVTDQKYSVSEVNFLPAVLPTKIVCVGQNYRGHIEELGMPVPKEPIIFLKPLLAVTGFGLAARDRSCKQITDRIY